MAEFTIEEALDRIWKLRQAGQNTEADLRYRYLLDQLPRDAKVFDALGATLALRDRWSEAATAWERALELAPSAEIHLNLAYALRRAGQPSQATERVRHALSLEPHSAPAHNLLGNLLREQQQLGDAIASFRRALELKPDYAEAINNLGSALLESGRTPEAIERYRQALALRPDHPDFHKNLGKALRAANDPAGAIAEYEAALSFQPHDAETRWNRGLMHLLSGHFEKGWEDYEWRWHVPQFKSPRRNFPQPLWAGEPLAGRRILLHAEQGFGDTIQFARYAPLVAAWGGRVILECPAPLHRLLRWLPGVEHLVIAGDPLPDFDLHCPLLSLPHAFRTTLESIPAAVPYLYSDPAQVQHWATQLQSPPNHLRVGLAWAGSPEHPDDRNRSISFDELAPLFNCPRTSFYSLQTGPAAAVGSPVEARSALIIPPSEFEDFADTAAFISNLDLVITVDTAVAHLAGALAAPVWTLLPFVTDWRWLTTREDSPWYPTMRLFRQRRAGDWHSVIQHVAEQLRQLSARLR